MLHLLQYQEQVHRLAGCRGLAAGGCCSLRVVAGCWPAAGRLAASVAVCSAWSPLDGTAMGTRLELPFWSRLFPSWRGVIGQLESVEASVGSDNAWCSEEEEGVTAVVLPVTVESLIMVSGISKDGGSSNSDKLLDSDIMVLSLGNDFSLVCQVGLASHWTHRPALLLSGGCGRKYVFGSGGNRYTFCFPAGQ